MKNLVVKFQEWISLMSFSQFHAFCGMLWDPKIKSFLKWDYWPGVRGYLGQEEVAAAIAASKISWMLKARQLGLSEIAGFYAMFIALTEPKSETIIISKKLQDSKYFLKRRVLYKLHAAYALELEPGKKFPWPSFEDNTDTGKIIFENGSIIEAVSSDNEETRSRTPRLVILDEARSFSNKDAEELWSAILPAIESNEMAQLISISSARFGTWFNEMSKQILAGDLKGINLIFLPDDTHPLRTPAWRSEARKKWPNQALFMQEHPMKPEDCFVSREGAVFPQFNPKPGGRHVEPVTLNWSYRYIIGYDHGRQHPAVLLLCIYDRYENHLYIFDELFCRGKELPEVAYAIREKLAFYSKNHNAPPPQLKIADRACFAQDGRKSVSDVLRDLTGITFKPSIKPDVVDSLDSLSARLSNNLLTIDPRCENTIRQIQELSWKNDPTESKRERPVDIEDDAVDVLRYICAELRGAVPKKEEPPSLLEVLDRKLARKHGRQEFRVGRSSGLGNANDWMKG